MSRVLTAIVAVFTGVLVLGAVAPAAAPVTLTTPISDSMEPTAPEHSLLVVVDAEPSVGDVALFNTPARSDPVLHRLVDTTTTASGQPGFLTQGDANPATDQATGDPVVTGDNIYGVVPSIAGVPVIIPFLGMLLSNPVLIIGLWVTLSLSLLYTTDPGGVIRGLVVEHPIHFYTTITAVAILVVLPVVILSTPAVIQAQILTSETAPEGSNVVVPGETTTHPIQVTSPFMAGVYTTAHTDSELEITTVESKIGSGTTRIEVRNPPSDVPERHSGDIIIYTYPPVLPHSILSALAAIHPLVAAVASAVVMSVPLLLLGAAMDAKRIVRANKENIYRVRRSLKE